MMDNNQRPWITIMLEMLSTKLNQININMCVCVCIHLTGPKNVGSRAEAEY